MRTTRASELGAYLYCRRAWWYQRQGIESVNQAEMAQGTEFHQQHSRQVFSAGLLRLGGWTVLLLALLALVIGLTLAALH